MQSTRKRSLIEFTYSLNDTNLNKVDLVKDLGIYIDSKLYFHEHVNHLVKSSKSIWFQINYITKNSNDLKQIKTLYLTLIRSRLEYGAVIWSRLTNTDKTKLDNIQNRLFANIRERFGQEKLDEVKLKLTPLDLRRKFLLAIFVFKTLCGKIDNQKFLNNIGLSTTLNSCRLKGLLSLKNHNDTLHKLAIYNFNKFRILFTTYSNPNFSKIWSNFDQLILPEEY